MFLVLWKARNGIKVKLVRAIVLIPPVLYQVNEIRRKVLRQTEDLDLRRMRSEKLSTFLGKFRSNFVQIFSLRQKKNLFRLGSGVLYRPFEIALFSVPGTVKSISSNVTRSRNAGYALEAQTLLVRKKKKTTFARLRNFFITAFHLAYFFVVLSNNSIYPNFLFSYELSSFSQGCSTTNWYS